MGVGGHFLFSLNLGILKPKIKLQDFMKLNFLSLLPQIMTKSFHLSDSQSICSFLCPRPFTFSGMAVALFLHGENNLSPFGNLTTFPQFTNEFWRVLEVLSCQGLSWGFHARNFSLLVGIYWPVTSMGGPWALVHKATLKTPGPFWTAGSFYDIPTSLILRCNLVRGRSCVFHYFCILNSIALYQTHVSTEGT